MKPDLDDVINRIHFAEISNTERQKKPTKNNNPNKQKTPSILFEDAYL